MLGVLDLGNPEIEPATVVADRIRNSLKHVAPDRLVVAPDCGMKVHAPPDRIRETEGDVRRRGWRAMRSASGRQTWMDHCRMGDRRGKSPRPPDFQEAAATWIGARR
jgi:hypothetical protein